MFVTQCNNIATTLRQNSFSCRRREAFSIDGLASESFATWQHREMERGMRFVVSCITCRNRQSRVRKQARRPGHVSAAELHVYGVPVFTIEFDASRRVTIMNAMCVNCECAIMTVAAAAAVLLLLLLLTTTTMILITIMMMTVTQR